MRKAEKRGYPRRRRPSDRESSSPTHATRTTPRAASRAPLAAASEPGIAPLSSAAVLAKLAPEYELVLMLDPEAPDERRDEIAVDARRRIEAGATLKQERTWGNRKMAYEIEQRNEADYRFFRFEDGTGRPRRPEPQPEDHRRRPPLPHLQGGPARPGDRPAAAALPCTRRLATVPAAAVRRRDGGYDDRPPRGPEAGQRGGSTAPAAPAAAPEAPAAEAPAAPAEAPSHRQKRRPAAEAPAAEAAPAEAEPSQRRPPKRLKPGCRSTRGARRGA